MPCMAYLKDRLVSMGPTQAQNFHDIIHAYEDIRGQVRLVGRGRDHEGIRLQR